MAGMPRFPMAALALAVSALARSAAAHEMQQNDGDLFALIQHSARGAPGPIAGTGGEEEAALPEEEAERRLVWSSWVYETLAKKHGGALAALSARGKGQRERPGLTQLQQTSPSELEVDDGHPRQSGPLCSDQDLSGMSEAILAASRGSSALSPSCSMGKIVGKLGINWKNYGICVEESQHVSEQCSRCFVHLTKGVIGQPLQPGCSRECLATTAACQDQEDRASCVRSLGHCLHCTRASVWSFASCAGLPYSQTFLQVFDDVITSSEDGTILLNETFPLILQSAMDTLGKEA